MADRPCRLFVYGTLLKGERDQALLGDSELLGPALSEPRFQLVELNVYAALIPDGSVAVHGELYATSLEVRRQIDVKRQVPILFQRCSIRLADGSEVETYVMTADQVRGKRRLAHGDWRQRFAPPPRTRPGVAPAIVGYAKSRFEK